MGQCYYPPGLPQTRPERRPSIVVLVIAAVVVIVVVVCTGLGAFGWRAFVRFGEATDFTEYHDKMQELKLNPAVRDGFLERMENLRDAARKRPISFLRWVDHDEAIRSVLDRMAGADPVSQDDIERLDRALADLEREFGLQAESEALP